MNIKACLIGLLLAAAVVGPTHAQAGQSEQQGHSDGFLIGPYVLDVTTTEATVAFHLHQEAAAEVVVQFPNGNEVPFPGVRSRSHFVRVDGLAPGSVYRYAVRVNDGAYGTPEADPTYQIRTAGVAGDSFSFVVYGDPRPGDSGTTRNHEEIVRRMLLHEPAFALILGDMVDDGRREELWTEFFRVESAFLRKTAAYVTMGDNDYAGGAGLHARYFPKLEPGYYSFEWSGVHFFGLRAWDTRGSQPRDEFGVGSEQMQWLESELSAEEVQAAPFRIVFLHDPIQISRGRASDDLRRVLEPLLRKHRVDAVFASWHLYERSHDQGVTYIISGGAGAEIIWMEQDPMYPSQAEAGRHHFCRVDINAETMTIRALAKDGTVLDAITKTPQPPEAVRTGRLQRVIQRLGERITMNDGAGGTSLPVYVFSYDCSYCKRLLRHDLPSLARTNGVVFDVWYFDLAQEGAYDLFLNAGAEFGRQGSDIPAVFVGSAVLGGENEISGQLPGEIQEFVNNPDRYLGARIDPFREIHDTTTLGEQSFNALTFGLVLGAGLLDGVNPCAFTTIIFLISYLSLVGASRRRMLVTGAAFTLAVFLTYFLMGLMFFQLASVLLKNTTVALVVNLVLLALVVVLSVLSFVDFMKARGGKNTDILLQLPDAIKRRIRGRIRTFARNTVAVTGTAFVLGVVISGMELTCTGQVYVPIVTMISEPQHRVAAVFYLIGYNVAFIAPLVAVFLFATFGMTSKRIEAFFKQHVATVKLGFSGLFAVMAVVIIFNLRWVL